MSKEVKIDNKYLMKFLYSLAAVFVGMFALTPFFAFFICFFSIIHFSFMSSPWWLLMSIPFLAVVFGFGKNIIKWMNDKFEFANDLTNKIEI